MATDRELEIILRIYSELAAMDKDGRRRAIRYLSDRLLPTAKLTFAERGASGGRARAAKLSPAERSAIATKAAAKRWRNDSVAQNAD